mmetsp:Transcript_938/g.2802  ORF Transcript_938/g.2802 Transcript_938/m.2802 type:complete len:217 (+) Transcript_938:810-1460(+)
MASLASFGTVLSSSRCLNFSISLSVPSLLSSPNSFLIIFICSRSRISRWCEFTFSSICVAIFCCSCESSSSFFRRISASLSFSEGTSASRTCISSGPDDVVSEAAKCAMAWGSPLSSRSRPWWTMDACSLNCGLIFMISRTVCMVSLMYALRWSPFSSAPFLTRETCTCIGGPRSRTLSRCMRSWPCSSICMPSTWPNLPCCANGAACTIRARVPV